MSARNLSPESGGSFSRAERNGLAALLASLGAFLYGAFFDVDILFWLGSVGILVMFVLAPMNLYRTAVAQSTNVTPPLGEALRFVGVSALAMIVFVVEMFALGVITQGLDPRFSSLTYGVFSPYPRGFTTLLIGLLPISSAQASVLPLPPPPPFTMLTWGLIGAQCAIGWGTQFWLFKWLLRVNGKKISRAAAMKLALGMVIILQFVQLM
jgi:hypothetical protein